MNVSNMLVKFEKDQLHIELAILDQKIKVEKKVLNSLLLWLKSGGHVCFVTE